MRAFLTACVQHGAATIGQGRKRLQKKRAFTNSGIATKQHHTARNKSAAKHAIKLRYATGNAGNKRRLNFTKRLRFAAELCVHVNTDWQHAGGWLCFNKSLQRIPCAAIWALAQPLWMVGATSAA